jgi:hypothetical protein
VKLPTPVVASGGRLYVLGTCDGGQPDNVCFTAYPPSAGGQGGPPRIVIAEIAVLCDSHTYPHSTTFISSSGPSSTFYGKLPARAVAICSCTACSLWSSAPRRRYLTILEFVGN